MAAFKQVPELIRIEGRWVLDYFKPAQAAFDWPLISQKLGTLYILESAEHVKIGITQNFRKRFSELNKSSPLPIRRVATRLVPLAGLAYAEAWMHHTLAKDRIKGEWFQTDADAAKALLPKAVRRAQIYAEYCRGWHIENVRSRQKNPGIHQDIGA